MNYRETYLLKRRKKRISLKKIAEFIGCHETLLSKYERFETNLSPEKELLYRQYIDQTNIIGGLSTI